MMTSMFDRVFGACLRNWVWPNEASHQKYIDYLPTRKWRYNDENLMNELTDNNSWDILDLADDGLLNNTTPRNVKLRLHDNVFLNPLNNSSSTDNNNDNDTVKELIPSKVETVTTDVVYDDEEIVEEEEVNTDIKVGHLDSKQSEIKEDEDDEVNKTEDGDTTVNTTTENQQDT